MQEPLAWGKAAARDREPEAERPLADTLRDWVWENPFFLHEIRRWHRKGLFARMLLACAGFPVGALLLLHGIQAWFFPHERDWFGRSYGLVALSAVSLLHCVVASLSVANVFSLTREAKADRLGFIRLLPMERGEMMAKIGVARAIFRLIALLTGLPVYALVFAYGGVPVEDVAALYALYAAFLFAPPALAEITAALTARHGDEAVTNPQSKKGVSPITFLPILGNLAFQFLGRFLLRPIIGTFSRTFTTVWGTQLGGLLPLSLILMVARFLWVPQPFFRWMVAPLPLLAGYWMLRTVVRIFSSAEIWAREPVVRLLPGGQKNVHLPQAEWLGPELRRLRWWGGVSGALASILWAGFLWRGMFLTGALGFLTGTATPGGGLATVVLLVLLAVALAMLETVRGGVTPLPQGVWRFGLERLAVSGARVGVIVALCAALGGVSLWPDVLLAYFWGVPAVLVTLLFAAGWRAALGTREGDAATGKGAGMRILLVTLLWFASYVGPLALLAVPNLTRDWPWLQCLGPWSPVYLLLSLMPGFWQGHTPLPWPVCFAGPAAAGALLLLAGRYRRGAAVAEPERPRNDALERRLREWAVQRESPFLSLAAHRMARRPQGPTQGLITSVIITLLISVLLSGLLVMAFNKGSGLAVWPLLNQPVPGGHGLKAGALAGLLSAAGILLFTLFPMDMSVAGLVLAEETTGRKQGRQSFLLMSGISDQQIVTGLIGSTLLPALPPLAGAWGVSLAWLFFGMAFGLTPLWLLPWIAALAAGLAVMLQGGLSAFGEWAQAPRWKSNLRRLGLGLRGIGFFLLGLIGFMVAISSNQNPLQAVMTALWLVPLLFLLTLPFLPRAYRSALAYVHRARLEENLERV